MAERPIKVVWGIPTEGFTNPMSLQSLLLMSFHIGRLSSAGEFEFFSRTSGRLFTPMARESILDYALGIDADYAFMVDDDMVCPPDLFEALYRHQVDIVSALAFTRNPPHNPVLYRIKEGWDPVNRREYVVTQDVRCYPRDKLVECDATGFGAVLIDMRIVKKMKRPYFMSSCGTGEDILFCIKARKEAGAHVFMDTSVKLGHVGHPVIITEETSEKYNDPEMMEKLFGPYEKHRVLDVIAPPKIPQNDEGEAVLSGVSG